MVALQVTVIMAVLMQPHKSGKNGSKTQTKRKGREEAAPVSKVPLQRRGKEARLQASAHARSKARSAALAHHRQLQAPVVVQLLPLSKDLDARALWCGFRNLQE